MGPLATTTGWGRLAGARAFMPAMVHSDDSRLEVFWPLSANAVAAVAATHSCGCYAAAAAAAVAAAAAHIACGRGHFTQLRGWGCNG